MGKILEKKIAKLLVDYVTDGGDYDLREALKGIWMVYKHTNVMTVPYNMAKPLYDFFSEESNDYKIEITLEKYSVTIEPKGKTVITIITSDGITEITCSDNEMSEYLSNFLLEMWDGFIEFDHTATMENYKHHRIIQDI
jgi:hypothetical protein